MPLALALVRPHGTSLFRKTRNTALLAGASALGACFPSDLSTRDYSAFQSYQYEQSHGLGFCPDTDRVFAAEITRAPDGVMSFAHSVLVKTGPDPEDCADGVAVQAGCFAAHAKPSRVLSPQEAGNVEAAFADFQYHKDPDSICQELAVDPCVIEQHVWDGVAFNDYICGVNRVSDEQRASIRNLLSVLRDGG